MRGRLSSRPAHHVIKEAEKLVDNGVKELLVISQDTSAYGLDLKHSTVNGHRAHIFDLARDLGFGSMDKTALCLSISSRKRFNSINGRWGNSTISRHTISACSP